MNDAMMPPSEREELSKVVLLRAMLTKASLETLAADRRADVRAQISAFDRADEEQWKEIREEAERAVREANAQITRICEERGISQQFRPIVDLDWWGRGENAVAAQRDELRYVAYERIEADREAGHLLVEAWAADQLTVLVSGTLTSAEAKAILDSLPSPELLLPPIRVTAELDGGVTNPQDFLGTER